MTLRQVANTGFGDILVNAGDQPTMIINRDLTNLLYISKDNSPGPKVASGNLSQAGDVSIIDPLSYMVFNGKSDVYGIGAAAPILVDIVKGATNWAPSPAQSAQQISLSGVPLVVGNTPLTNVNAQSVVVGTPFTRTINNISGVSYCGSITVSATSTAYCEIDVTWQDNNGNEIRHERWWIVPGTVGSPHLINIQGPTGAQTVVWTVTAAVGNITYTDNILQNGLISTRHEWRSANLANSPNLGVGFTVGLHNMGSLELFILNGSVNGGGTTNQYLLPFFVGRVRLWAFMGGAGTDLHLTLTNYADQGAGISNQAIWASTTVNNTISQEFSLPRAQTVLDVQNNNANPLFVQAAIIAEEY